MKKKIIATGAIGPGVKNKFKYDARLPGFGPVRSYGHAVFLLTLALLAVWGLAMAIHHFFS